jgi:hypothetical protein
VKTLIKLIFLGIVAGGWVLSSAALYVVRTPGDTKAVVFTKNELGFKDTYVDARNWTLADTGAHQKLVERMVQLDKQDAMAFLVDTNKGDVKSQLLEAAAKGPPAAPEPAKAEPSNAPSAPVHKLPAESTKHNSTSASRL